uniref:Sodium/calcium exchanger membrane region domain-containing protein n=1 Tax=Euplotes crassus TaxID=5936 RepID=A0A7S3P2Y2_EUPCR|mmetsp:Transcript_7550/g.7094  ORF Transcript_7550/g.7094 Transcript_7550/m.7094 type:complete len:300 (+) Transcript_7550:358-1257(+)
MSDSESVNPEEFESIEMGSQNEKISAVSKRKLQMTESGNLAAIGTNKPKENNKEDESKNEAEKEFDEFEDDISSTEAESKTIYDRINERVNKKVSLAFPKKFRERLMYIFTAPLTYTQFISIPNVIVPGRENFYPLSLFMSIAWIYAYTFIIVWWTYELSEAWGINRSIIPLIFYPIGISIRDSKKIIDFLEVKKMFAEELQDQEISLAETFSGPIFQITGLVGFTWLIKILSSGEAISFDNGNIQFQAPILLLIIVMKYGAILIARYRTSKKLFVFNGITYTFFTFSALLFDYYDKIS